MPFTIGGDWIPPEEHKEPSKPQKHRSIKVREQKRGNKMVTTILNLPHSKQELDDFLMELKKLCASGGTVKDGVIEVQGKHQEKLVQWLQKKGLKVS